MLKTVLVVAGYPPVRDWIARCLETEGYLALAAKDEDEALRLASLIGIDLVITWPTVSGFSQDDFLAAVSSYPPLQGVPVLVATFRSAFGEIRPCDGWIRAPLTADKVTDSVRPLLGDGGFRRRSSVEVAHGPSIPQVVVKVRCRWPRPSVAPRV